MLINDDLTHSHTIAIKAPGRPTSATLIRLRGRSAGSAAGVSIAGQTLGTSTTTGQPAGREQRYAVATTHGEYVVKVPPASAALLVR